MIQYNVVMGSTAVRPREEQRRMYAVIMAGGGGTRLWPKSRERHPKQMHPLVGAKPLVQEMTERLHRIVGDGRVFIIANSHHAQGIEGVMPSMAGRILVDPYRRDTAGCVGLAAVYISKLDPNAVMGVFPADHFMSSEDEFEKAVRVAGGLAEAGHVVTIGVRPRAPETGYGYIEMGDLSHTVDGQQVYCVRRFVEKPDRKTAGEYCASGRFLWNSGVFVWSIPTVLRLFKKHLPDTYDRLMRIREAIGMPDEEVVVDREYEQMKRISIDYGIMEKLDDMLVLPGDFGWSDIGSWTSVCDVLPKDPDGNTVRASHIGLDTRNCLVLGEEGRVVATVGVEDLIIVDTGDALLICRKDRAQDVKKVVDKLKEQGMEEYL